jgi:Rrf2 family protein
MGMGSSTRFALGIHLLTALAANPGKVLCSEDIADSVNTNPVVVRRLFALLTAAGLARARLGQGGGFELARPASDITLLDIFAALEKTDLFAAPRSPPSASCRVGAHILPVLHEPTARAVRALRTDLSRTTVSDIASAVLARNNKARKTETPSSRKPRSTRYCVTVMGINERLAGRRRMLGDVYTIADMPVWDWGRGAAKLLGPGTWSKMTNLKRLIDEVNARPAVARVDNLKERHAFKQESMRGAAPSVRASHPKGELDQR